MIDVLHDVDHRFATLARRQDRVIAGCSAGAYGAVNVALHHLSDFGSVQSWSGYFLQTKSGVFAHASHAALAYNSPLDYTRQLRSTLATYPLRASMIVGRGDPAYSQQQPMVRLLRLEGARVQYHVYPGGHGWGVWIPHLNEMLDMASADMTHPLASVSNSGPPQGSSRQGALPGAQTPSGGAGAPGGGAAAHRRNASTLRLLEALLLALVSAALINLGFVFQHRGHSQRRAGLVSVVRDRSWLIGQGVGWLGFLGQIAAVALAPLTLVQAFSAGSLALSVPLVARLFGHRVGRPQLAAIGVIALSLATLPIGLGGGHGHLHAGTLIGGLLVTILIAGVLAPGGGPLRFAVAAGLLYGAGDAAIKAAAVALRLHHPAGSVAGWAALVAFCTFLGFLSFQAALRKGDAIRPLMLMNAFTAVAAALLGITAFGESLGSTPTATILHAVAIALVLISVRPLAAAQQRLIDPDANVSSSGVTAAGLRIGRAGQPRRVVRGALTLLLSGGAIVIASALVVGLLYGFRGLGWFSRGPRIGDALPLLQLAGFDGQPFGRGPRRRPPGRCCLGRRADRAPVARPGGDSDACHRCAALRVRCLICTGPQSSARVRDDRPVTRTRSLDRGTVGRRWLPGDEAGSQACPGSGSRGVVVRVGTSPSSAQSGGERSLTPAPWRLHAGRRPPVRAVVVMVVLAGAVAAALGAAGARSRRSSPPAPSRSIQTLSLTCRSPALGGHLPTLVYLPPGYSSRGRRYPVVYFLHGLPATPQSYTQNVFVARSLVARGQRAIVVAPQGARTSGDDREYLDWSPTENWPQAITHDLSACVDHRFHTIAGRRGRVLIGLSAGGYGALNIGLRNLQTFGAVESWSGYFAATDPSGYHVLTFPSPQAQQAATVPSGAGLADSLSALAISHRLLRRRGG